MPEKDLENLLNSETVEAEKEILLERLETNWTV